MLIIVASLMESGVEVDPPILNEAINSVNCAISLDPSYSKYRVTRARLNALKGDLNKAYIDFDKAVSLLHPTSLNIQSISPILNPLDYVQTFCRRIRELLTVLLKKLKT